MNKIKVLNICVAGLGNVGAALVSYITSKKEEIKKKSQLEINIVGVSAKNISKKRNCDISSFSWFDNALDLLSVNNCDVLIELIGQEKDLSYELVKTALEKKLHVVTGNKAMLALYGGELFKIAEKNDVLLLYEAAVAGGIPIIKLIKNNLFLNKIKKISGILNGTTNYILSKMQEDNLSFDEVLKIAKSKGYTSDKESDLDIGGLDAAHKLTILSTLAFGSEIDFSLNETTGINNITIEDIKFANQLGYRIKLISETSLIDGKINAVTCPRLIPKFNPIANVNGPLNAVNIETDQLQNLFLEGEGAGGKATASSIISDLYEIASNTSISSLGFSSSNLKKYIKFENHNIESNYYVRIMTKDLPGVLSKITSYFNESKISIEKILQIPDNKEIIPIIISTHRIKSKKLINAITKIQSLSFVMEKISIIQINQDI